MNNAFENLLNDTAERIIENNIEDVYMGDAEVIPVNNNVLIEPYIRNPYRYIETTSSGLIVGAESSKTYKSNETGEIVQNTEVIHAGKVISKGDACKYVNVGDDVFYTTYSMTPIPFRKKGYVMVSEGLLICKVIRK